MTSSGEERSVAKITLAAIGDMSEKDLVTFVLDHCTLPGECPVTNTSAWTSLPKRNRLNLIQKFRQAQHRICKSDVGCPDKDYLDQDCFDKDRLDSFLQHLVISSGIGTRNRVPYGVGGSERRDEFTLTSSGKRRERWHYQKLLEEHGRPAYPVEQMDQLSANPEKFYHIVSPWMHLDESWWKVERSEAKVFQKQHDHWISFRVWQYVNRNNLRRKHPQWEKAEVEVGDLELADSAVQWYKERMYRSRETYSMAVTKRLAELRITETVTLKRDPRQQGKLETWLEYLCFTSWHLEWAHHDLESNSVNGREFLIHMIGNVGLRFRTEMEDVQSMMYDAWAGAEYLDLDQEYRHLAQQRDKLFRRMRRLGNGTDAKANLRKESRASKKRLKSVDKSLDSLANRYWELNHSQYESDWPWCIAARKVFCYEKLVVWVRDQLPMVRAEVGAIPRSLSEGPPASTVENNPVASLSPGVGSFENDRVAVTGDYPRKRRRVLDSSGGAWRNE